MHGTMTADMQTTILRGKTDIIQLGWGVLAATAARHSDSKPRKARAAPKAEPVLFQIRARRNEPCPCGSGKKFKKCCKQGSEK
jgi:uncharacterized protein YecA (UPF0149 family)